MNNIEKLIENGGWRPISESPKDGRYILAQSSDGALPCVLQWNGRFALWLPCELDDDELTCEELEEEYSHLLDSYGCPDFQKSITKWMPLDTPERMAKVIKHYDAALRALESLIFPFSAKSGMLSAAHEFTENALLEADKIAGGDNV